MHSFQGLDPGDLATWVGAAINAIVVAVAVGVVFVQHRLTAKLERDRVARRGATSATAALNGLKLIRELEAQLNSGTDTASFDKSWSQFRLGIAVEAVRVSINQDHVDPALIEALIETEAWVKIVLSHAEQPMWLWARLPASAQERSDLEAQLQRMLSQFLSMLGRK